MVSLLSSRGEEDGGDRVDRGVMELREEEAGDGDREQEATEEATEEADGGAPSPSASAVMGRHQTLQGERSYLV